MNRKKGTLIIVRKVFEKATVNLDDLTDAQYETIVEQETDDEFPCYIMEELDGLLSWERDDFEDEVPEDIISVDLTSEDSDKVETIYEA